MNTVPKCPDCGYYIETWENYDSLSCETIKFVTHSIASIKGFDIFRIVLKQGFIKPNSWKAGFSINGCYAVDGYSIDAVLIFDYKKVKEKLKPVLYFPLEHYDWFQTPNYLITWDNLTWEAELALLQGETIPLDLCKAIVVSRRKWKLREQLKQRFKILDSLPSSPLQEFSKMFRKAGTQQRHRLSNQYNKWICRNFGLNYDEIKRNLPSLIEQKYGQNKRCGICKHFHFEIKSLNPLQREMECRLTNTETDFNGLCDQYSFNLASFLNLEGWKAYE